MPFDDVKEVAERGVSTRQAVTLKTSKYWLELLIGDLSYSANRTPSDVIYEQLDALCTRLEIESSDDSRLLYCA